MGAVVGELINNINILDRYLATLLIDFHLVKSGIAPNPIRKQH